MPLPFSPIDTDLLELNSIPVLEDVYGQIQEEMHELEISNPESSRRLHLHAEMLEVEAEILRLRTKHGVQSSPVEAIVLPSPMLFG